jgi:ADP-glucose pyrophosphorylase
MLESRCYCYCYCPQGASIAKASITNAVIGLRSTIGEGCTITDAMVMGGSTRSKGSDSAACRVQGFS